MEKYKVNIWVNEERYRRLKEKGLYHLAKDVLAGMKVIEIFCTEEEKEKILKLFPTAKLDTSTTKSIELLPPEVKNRLFELILKRKSLDVVREFLEEEEKKKLRGVFK
ncbi:hypothetical protein H5U35_05085 [Candidatus Aerophobetes bacterium]|nr:hypothetical protein [Candidatus Aerophobetes bacterium]